MKTKATRDSDDPGQLTLGTANSAGPARARSRDPETSKAAAESLTLANMRASQIRVLKLFNDYGDMDDRALRRVAEAEHVKMSDSGLRSRRSELSKPNMDRLDEMAADEGACDIGPGTFSRLPEEIRAELRRRLRVEGFRSPLWDTGKRVEYEGGRTGIVWGKAV
jgi:hypothetical protein